MILQKEKQIEYIDKIMDWCFIGLVFILPIAHTMTIRSVFIYLPIFLWLYKMALKREVLFVNNQMAIPLSLFAIIATFSMFTAVDPRYTLHELRGEMVTDFLLFFLLFNNIRTAEQINKIILSLIIGSIVQGVYSSVHYFSLDWNLLDPGINVGGLTAGNISYSVFLITVIPFIIYKIITSTGKSRYFFAAALILNLFMLCLTHQRGALLALFIQFLLFFWFIRRWLLALLLVGVGILFLFIMPSSLVYHGAPKIDLKTENALEANNSINSRIAIWKFTIKEIVKRPFIGIGFGRYSFAAKYQQFRRTGLWHSHNTLLNLTLQLGIQGLLIFTFILYRLIMTAWRGFKETKGEPRYFFLGVFIFIVGFFVRNMFDDHYVDDNAQMFWVLIGINTALFIHIQKLAYNDIFSRSWFLLRRKNI